jgi:hypothetical protein
MHMLHKPSPSSNRRAIFRIKIWTVFTSSAVDATITQDNALSPTSPSRHLHHREPIAPPRRRSPSTSCLLHLAAAPKTTAPWGSATRIASPYFDPLYPDLGLPAEQRECLDRGVKGDTFNKVTTCRCRYHMPWPESGLCFHQQPSLPN